MTVKLTDKVREIIEETDKKLILLHPGKKVVEVSGLTEVISNMVAEHYIHSSPPEGNGDKYTVMEFADNSGLDIKYTLHIGVKNVGAIKNA